jgi:hypothetical protein
VTIKMYLLMFLTGCNFVCVISNLV